MVSDDYSFILRYLLQQGKPGQPVLLAHELDAFLSAALSPHISTEFNPANLSQLKIMRVDVRGVQLAAIFMEGVQAAAFANDACGCPVPWEYVCPWNYFDGKLFMSKYLQASSDMSQLDLCDGKVSYSIKCFKYFVLFRISKFLL